MNVYNALGQEANFNPQTTASGVYWLTDDAIAELQANNELNCPEGMRPGLLHIRGVDTIQTCSGRIYTEQLPDIHVVDWRYRKYVQLALIALALIMLVAVGLKFMR